MHHLLDGKRRGIASDPRKPRVHYKYCENNNDYSSSRGSEQQFSALTLKNGYDNLPHNWTLRRGATSARLPDSVAYFGSRIA